VAWPPAIYHQLITSARYQDWSAAGAILGAHVPSREGGGIPGLASHIRWPYLTNVASPDLPASRFCFLLSIPSLQAL